MEPRTDAPAHRASGEVVCLGLATRDTIVPMPAWPSPDGRLVVDRIERSGGGPAATAAVALARLGVRVTFIGAVGDDAVGHSLLADLGRAGVAVELAEVRPGRTAESVILLDRSAGTRSILHAPGVALPSLGSRAADACRAARWIHVDHAGHPLARQLDPGRLSIDAGNPIEGLSLAGVGLYAPTAAALASRFPAMSLVEAAMAARTEGAERVVVTAGADGALAIDATGAWRMPALAAEVVSTLGAGDVFHGALVAALVDGHALPEATRRASVAAALSCRALDGRAGIPTSDELEAALAGAPPVEPIVLGDGR